MPKLASPLVGSTSFGSSAAQAAKAAATRVQAAAASGPRKLLRHDGRTPKGGKGRSSLQLQQERDTQQLRAFTRWWNDKLAAQGMSVTDLIEDIKSGVKPIRLLEVLAGEPFPSKFAPKPVSKFQMLENLNTFLEHLKQKGVKLVNIGSEDLYGGDQTLVLGLT